MPGPHRRWRPTVTAHEPERPKWNCATCGFAWPCEPARRQLTADFEGFPTSLAVYMAQFHGLAMDDAVASFDTFPPDLWERFLGWLPGT